jgi:hypothetical protein
MDNPLMDHTQSHGSEPTELSDAELAVVHGGSLFSWIKKRVKEIIHGITHQNEPEPGQPFGSDPTYHHPEEIYQRPNYNQY